METPYGDRVREIKKNRLQNMGISITSNANIPVLQLYYNTNVQTETFTCIKFTHQN